jgi:hypothetical protein
MKVWVALENEGVDYWGEIWDRMGTDNVFAQAWEKQKVAWLPKPGKNSSMQKNKRGIMLQDGAGKAYLTWLQRRMRKDMKGRWKGDMYGGIEGRGTQHAMLRVYGVREHLRTKKISTATYLSDVKKAFDKVNRRKGLKKGEEAPQGQRTIPQNKKEACTGYTMHQGGE